jgi:hypothetical protein
LGQQENRARIYGIDPSSWQEMQAILDRRADPPQPWSDVFTDETVTPQAELHFQRALRRAERITIRREATLYAAHRQPMCALARITRALKDGASSPKDILTATDLDPVDAGDALRQLEEFGLVYECRPSHFAIAYALSNFGEEDSRDISFVLRSV